MSFAELLKSEAVRFRWKIFGMTARSLKLLVLVPAKDSVMKISGIMSNHEYVYLNHN